MSPPSDPAEARFERYLDERGYRHDYEPDLGNGKRPDYLVVANERELVCEVKSFNTAGVVGSAQTGARLQEEVLKPIRKHITTAAEQLKGIEGRPLVVVLANPRGCPVPLDAFSVMAAMYGDVAVEFNVDADGAGGDVTWTADTNRKLAVVDPETGERVGGDHEYMSAIVILRRKDVAFEGWSRRWWNDHGRTEAEAPAFAEAALADGVPHSEDVYLEIFETLSDRAVALPRDILNGPHDRRWVPNGTRTALIPLL